MNLKVGEHNISSHVVGAENQIAVGLNLYIDDDLSPFCHERSCRSHCRSNGLVTSFIQEKVHIVSTSYSNLTIDYRGRLHPIGNGVETGRELPCTAQRLSLLGRSALTVDGVLAVRAYVGLNAPDSTINGTTRLVGPAFQTTLANIEGTIRHDVGIKNFEFGCLGVNIVAGVIRISAYRQTHQQQLHK